MKIDRAAMSVLDRCTINANIVYLPNETLPRPLYVLVNKALEAMGGKWDRKAKGHIFDVGADVQALMENAIETGEVVCAKSDLDFFPTPKRVASRIAELAWDRMTSDSLVLEPSAGHGALIKEIRALSDKVDIFAVEVNPDFFHHIKAAGANAVLHEDFLKCGFDQCYDIIVANPPFSKQRDIDHVDAMLTALNPGGRLVAVMAAGITFRTNRKTTALIDRLNAETTYRFEELPQGAFKESGTMVNTVLLVADRI